jgi:hypothetical protein
MELDDDSESPNTFDPIFEPGDRDVPRYLELLHLRTAGDTCRCLRVLVRNEGAAESVSALLTVRNWRPHLVACAAAIAFETPLPRATLDEFWLTGTSSWVAPQIAAALSLVDPEFEARARNWLLAVGNIPAAQQGPLAPEVVAPEHDRLMDLFDDPNYRQRVAALAHRHSAEGPVWGLASVAKWAASLLGLLPNGTHLKEATPDVARLLGHAEEGDWGKFAHGWRTEIVRIFEAEA